MMLSATTLFVFSKERFHWRLVFDSRDCDSFPTNLPIGNLSRVEKIASDYSILIRDLYRNLEERHWLEMNRDQVQLFVVVVDR